MHWVLFQILLIKCFENHELGLCHLLIYTHRYPVPGCASCSAFTVFCIFIHLIPLLREHRLEQGGEEQMVD